MTGFRTFYETINLCPEFWLRLRCLRDCLSALALTVLGNTEEKNLIPF